MPLSIADAIAQLRHYIDPKTIATAGYIVMTAVVFAETGLAAGFFFPGDSLLVVAGLFAAKGDLSLPILLSTLTVAGILGDAVGFWTGAKLGKRLFSKPESLLFKPSHLKHAHDFYLKHGNKTIIMARFVPIVRTFAPIVAGAADMPYGKFVVYNIVGGVTWVFSMLLGGYFLGQMIPNLDKHVDKVAIIVIFLSLLPPLYEYLKSRKEKRT
jgi:membrane-associated protein